MNDAAETSWAAPDQAPEARPGRSDEDIASWEALTERVARVAGQHGWSKAEVARRSGMPEGTFSQWYSGKYAGRLDAQNAKMSAWLEAVDEMQSVAATIPEPPGFVVTRSGRDVIETLTFAQMMPDFVVITLAAGMGKTAACRHYVRSRPNAFLVTMSPHTKTVHGMLVELSAALDIMQHNPAKLSRAIGQRLRRTGSGSLLIVDEAQNLKDDAVDQLRHLVDIYECGVALVGNEEIYSRFQRSDDGPSYAQIRRRIGKRLRRRKPRPEDIAAILDAWKIEDPGARKFLTGIGNKPGALGQIDKTLRLGFMLAAGAGQPLNVDHLKAAWSNRDVEGV